MSIATKCTCGHSLTGVCTSSVKECRQLKKEGTLPKEVVNNIEQEAHDSASSLYSPNNYNEFTCYQSGYTKGATTYATKLHQAEEQHKQLIKTLLEIEDEKRNEALKVLTYDNNRLKGEVEGLRNAVEELKGQNEKLKATATGWRPLLEDILREDDNNIAYISVDLINKIKKFLYGE